MSTVFLSIITRNHRSPFDYLSKFLNCIDNLDYDKSKITIYINTNNNCDDTVSVLMNWVNTNHASYKKIIFEHSWFSDIDDMDVRWTTKKLSVMQQVRQKSLDVCSAEKSEYYFVLDTDNWVEPCTLKYLIAQQKPIVAPFLKDYAERNVYSNFFYVVNEWGFLGDDSGESTKIWRRDTPELIGTIEVPLVHCCYLINCKHINDLSYIGEVGDWEFIVFANSARKNKVTQYLCNERMFGFVRYDTIVNEETCIELLTNKAKKDNNE